MSKFLERLQSLFACFAPKTSSQVGTVYSRDLSSFAAPNGQKIMLFSSTDITQATMPDGIATADGWIYAQTAGVLEQGDKCRWVRVWAQDVEYNSSTCAAPKEFENRIICTIAVRKGQKYGAYMSQVSSDVGNYRFETWFIPID